MGNAGRVTVRPSRFDLWTVDSGRFACLFQPMWCRCLFARDARPRGVFRVGPIPHAHEADHGAWAEGWPVRRYAAFSGARPACRHGIVFPCPERSRWFAGSCIPNGTYRAASARPGGRGSSRGSRRSRSATAGGRYKRNTYEGMGHRARAGAWGSEWASGQAASRLRAARPTRRGNPCLRSLRFIGT